MRWIIKKEMSGLNVVGSLQERGRSLEKMTWEAAWGGEGGWTFWKGRVSGNSPGGGAGEGERWEGWMSQKKCPKTSKAKVARRKGCF